MDTSSSLIPTNIESLLANATISNRPHTGTFFMTAAMTDNTKTTLFNPFEDKYYAFRRIQKKQQLLTDKITQTNNHSLRKIQLIQRKKRRSLEPDSIDTSKDQVRRYNMSGDDRIDFSHQQSLIKPNFFKPFSSPRQFHEDNLLRRERNTQNLIKSRSKKSRFINGSVHIRKISETFDFNHQVQKPRQYIPKRKLWSSTKVIISRHSSPRDYFTITNTKLTNKKQKPNNIAKCQEQSPFRYQNYTLQKVNIEKIQRYSIKSTKRREIKPIGDSARVNEAKKSRISLGGRNCKQIYLSKLLKSKIQISRRQQNICGWGVQEEEIPEELLNAHKEKRKRVQ